MAEDSQQINAHPPVDFKLSLDYSSYLTQFKCYVEAALLGVMTGKGSVCNEYRYKHCGLGYAAHGGGWLDMQMWNALYKGPTVLAT